MSDYLMTISELAMYLGLGLRTLCRYLRVHPLAQKDAQLPAIRIEGFWRFRKEDVDRWLRQHPVLDASPRRQPHILVVDDDENIRSVLLDLFEASGYGVHGVEDGEAALALLGEVSFDLLMVDLRMPGMDGVELIRHAKSLHPHLRVIILTGNVTRESAIDAVCLGVSDILEKPIRNLRALESAVELALNQRECLLTTDDEKVLVSVNGTSNGNGREDRLNAFSGQDSHRNLVAKEGR